MESAKRGTVDYIRELLSRRPIEPKWLAASIWGFIALGLALRVVRYLVNYPIWHDEAFVAVNFLDRGYLDLMRPLDYSQVCPLLFLWLELTAVKLWGYSEWSLRFFPTLCALASVGLFWDLARQYVRGLPLLLAVAIFSVAFTPIRHGAEIKPYATDLFAALILLRIATQFARNPESSQPLWLLVAITPFMLCLSYPAVFVASASCLALAPKGLTSHRRSVRMAYLLCNASVLLSFLGLYIAFTSAQSSELTSYYRWGYWADSFPPLSRPWLIPWWLLQVHVGMFMAYPVGGDAGASSLTFICVLIGAIVLWKTNRRSELALLTVPFGMGLLAACLGRYPYGGEARFMQYLAPSTCLLMGMGLAESVEWLDRRSSRSTWSWTRGAVAGLAILGVGQLLLDFVKPYRDKEDVQSRRFSQWLWNDQAIGAELVCAKTDLGLMFDTNPLKWQRGISSIYQCYQGLYSPRHHRRFPPDLRRVSDSHPLRIVFFDTLPEDNPSFNQWLTSLERTYRLRNRKEYEVYPKKSKESWKRDGCVVLEFVPRTGADAPNREMIEPEIAERPDFFLGRF